MVKDKVVMDLTLQQRYAILKRIINPKPKLLEIVEQRPSKSTNDIVAALDQAIMNREEGIMLKNLDSTYVPAERKNKWIKLKPEYLDGVGDDLDVIILGGYYGTGLGRRGGTVSHFMVGVVAEGGNTGSAADATAARQPPTLFYSLAKVGSGYSDRELKALQKELEPHWRVFNTVSPPKCMQLAEGFKEKPDVWIDPQHSRLLQVKAAQIVPSDRYRAGYTLRFPRVVKFRTDKSWDDCMTHPELLTLINRFEGRYAKRQYGELLANGTINGDGNEKPAKKRKVAQKRAEAKKGLSVLQLYRDTDTANVGVVEDVFHGKELCLLNVPTTHSKMQLETLIVQHGGTKVQHPTLNTYCAVAASKTLKVQNLIAQCVVDVVDITWLLDCLARKSMQRLEPKFDPVLFSCSVYRS
eukprot:TRINITY_DN2365_c0_g1_i9.p1 TRINITY_DN2365_c0_g1~~TRINITY_DN2365_c0_g1_i9.p1  ORF type:complete len:411 (-),score=102.92 TRINITY_DN2365_c0_g1_i9:757-1989(-)